MLPYDERSESHCWVCDTDAGEPNDRGIWECPTCGETWKRLDQTTHDAWRDYVMEVPQDEVWEF